MTKVRCSGCGTEFPEQKAQVPGLVQLGQVVGGMDNIVLDEHVYCPYCAGGMRHHGIRLYSLTGSRQQLEQRLAARKALQERIEALKNAEVRACGPCNRPVRFDQTELVVGQGRFCKACAGIRKKDIARKAEAAEAAKQAKAQPVETTKPAVQAQAKAPASASGEVREFLQAQDKSGFAQTLLPQVEIKTLGKGGKKLTGAAAQAQKAKVYKALAASAAK